MIDWRYGLTSLVLGTSLAIAGCGDDHPMGPSNMGPGGMPVGSFGFMSVSPRGGTRGVPVGTALEFHWGVPMGFGMEQFIDLHMGDLAGSVTPMSCDWSADRTTLVCTPSSPLQPGTRYLVHVGGGMLDANGQLVDMVQYGPSYGGQWIQGGMMGVGHAGEDWSTMGGGWRHSNGAFGMVFTFTTS